MKMKKTMLPVLVIVAGLSALLFATGARSLEQAPAGGTVSGFVGFTGAFPERERIRINRDQAVCGAAQYSEDFVVSEDTKGLKNVIVSIAGIDKGKRAPSGAVASINQKKCQYVPHVQAALAGTTLEIFNEDGILHNVHAYTTGPTGEIEEKKTFFNKAHPKFLEKLTQRLRRPGIYYFQCDVHSHMSAYIAVFDHAYYAMTDENGRYTIENVPVGSYKVQVWHEGLGAIEKDVTVVAGETAEVNLEIAPN